MSTLVYLLTGRYRDDVPYYLLIYFLLHFYSATFLPFKFARRVVLHSAGLACRASCTPSRVTTRDRSVTVFDTTVTNVLCRVSIENGWELEGAERMDYGCTRRNARSATMCSELDKS